MLANRHEGACVVCVACGILIVPRRYIRFIRIVIVIDFVLAVRFKMEVNLLAVFFFSAPWKSMTQVSITGSIVI
jgi:hypothetical protein